ncbi:MAG: Fe-S cluster assembly protein SufD [Candidatus Caenarcaniphilales bacterium]|nr:Fe-S cluster assembly protein SufD [Candidatus Caenarcaniphilales bacterium]
MSNTSSGQFLAELITERLIKSQAAQSSILEDLARDALNNAIDLGMPDNQLEEWKYVDLPELYRLDLKPLEKLDFNDHGIQLMQKESELYQFVPAQINLINGQIVPGLSKVSDHLGIHHHSLTEVYQAKTAFFESHFNRLAEKSAFNLLNTGFCEGGLVLDLPPHHDPKEILLIQNYSIPDSASSSLLSPRLLLRLGANAHLKLVLVLNGEECPRTYLNNLLGEIYLSPNSSLELTLIQNEASRAYHLSEFSFALEEEANLKINHFCLGGAFSKSKIMVDLRGKHAQAELNGLYALGGSAHSHNQIAVNHIAPHTLSKQFYKGVLSGTARGEFTGTINVAKEALKTDASQLNQNLLLSEKAHIDTRPQLQISADDVKCGHGASIGQLAEEQIFYFQTRGLSRADAQKILTFGFAEEIIEKVHPPELIAKLNNFVMNNLGLS